MGCFPIVFDAMFLILGHLVIRLKLGFLELPVDLGFRASIAPLLEHMAERATNRAADERRKKDKDDEEKKRWATERAKLQRGKRRQGSLEEDEEEEEEGEDDGSGSPIPWDDLAGGDEDPPSPQAWPFPWHLLEQEGEDTLLETAGVSRPAPFGPSEQREGSKRERDEEWQPGSGGSASKRRRPVASR